METSLTPFIYNGDKKAVLVIDGGYFHKGLSKQKRKIDVKKFLNYMEQKTGNYFEKMYYFDSAPDRCDKYFHRMLRQNQIRVELNGLKSMKVKCPNSECHYNRPNSAIDRTVQAGVDVSIATKILTLVCENQLDTLVLFAGDGDFLDVVKFVSEQKHKEVWIVGFRGSLSSKLQSYASRNSVFFVDNDLDVFSEPYYRNEGYTSSSSSSSPETTSTSKSKVQKEASASIMNLLCTTQQLPKAVPLSVLEEEQNNKLVKSKSASCLHHTLILPPPKSTSIPDLSVSKPTYFPTQSTSTTLSQKTKPGLQQKIYSLSCGEAILAHNTKTSGCSTPTFSPFLLQPRHLLS
eukprot:TRINITY_DN6364_c0_g1_i1.p1 TRINITY_DN6364_c0_g1~~TRINITY_DN6364_c0_g1_i1.p1  ORF type:complete len:347 (+),score=54.11 TRINITY_DN6364_c0_g1_i1:142-1182(+)